MKAQIAQSIATAITQLQAQGELPDDLQPNIRVDHSKDPSHGDYASNIALMLAKPAGKNPRELATSLIAALPQNPHIARAEIAGPGFINFFLNSQSQTNIVTDILNAKDQFGLSTQGEKKRIQVEFVSANPTGPLHVGHGRGAAYGSVLSNLLEATGFEVCREYYVNDAGRQMDILAASAWLRYLDLCGESVAFPSNGYQGDYVVSEIAQPLFDQYAKALCRPTSDIFAGVCADEPAGGDKEAHIDDLINRAKTLLGDDYTKLFDAGLQAVLSDIKDDLGQFGINFQTWFSEKSLSHPDQIEQVIDQLQQQGHVYEKEGALWFRSTDFGDDKDRVVKRENGQTTYFASDIAYHKNKFERGFDQIINIWGADHHGYIARVMAALKALGLDSSKLTVLLVQFAILYRGDERLAMSTRSGSFVTLRELREEVGSDACRFFYASRKSEQHMDFDLELAKTQSKDNPVYYVQYAHARVCSVMGKLGESGRQWDQRKGLENLSLLSTDHEVALLRKLSEYPETLNRAAKNFEPHQLVHYLRDLAADFHTYYNAHKMLIEDEALRNARLCLSQAVAQVLKNGLGIIGVNAPQKM